jgi:hypothetical protein
VEKKMGKGNKQRENRDRTHMVETHDVTTLNIKKGTSSGTKKQILRTFIPQQNTGISSVQTQVQSKRNSYFISVVKL